MSKITITCFICIFLLASCHTAEVTKNKSDSSIPYLEQRLDSGIWQVRYSLLSDLNGHDEDTKQIFEKLLKDENDSVRNQTLVRYLHNFVYVNKELFNPIDFLVH